jgi:hypothetical protein
MNGQGWIVLGIAAVLVLLALRKFIRTLARKGAGAGCCCDGACGRRKARTP